MRILLLLIAVQAGGAVKLLVMKEPPPDLPNLQVDQLAVWRFDSGGSNCVGGVIGSEDVCEVRDDSIDGRRRCRRGER